MQKPHNLFLLLIIISVLIIVPGHEAFAAITHQATVSGSTEGGTTCTVDANVQASTDAIVVGIITDSGITSVTDEDTQTYTQQASYTAGGGADYAYIYTTVSPATNAANTITVTAPSGDLRCFATTLSGTDTSSIVGNTGSNGGTSAPSSDTITYSTANDNSLIIHVCGSEWNDTYTYDTGKTEQAAVSDGGANKFGGSIATETTTTAGSNDATCDFPHTGVEWAHAVAEIKELSTTDYNENPSDNLSITDSVTTHVVFTHSDNLSITDSFTTHVTKVLSDRLRVLDGYPIAQYEFESNLNDSSGMGNTGSMGSGSASYTTGLQGSSAFNFDGTNHILADGVSESNFDFDRDMPFSFTYWMKTSTSGSTQSLIVKKGSVGGFDGYASWIRGTDIVSARLSSNSVHHSVNTSPEVDDGLWRFYAVTYDGNSDLDGLKVYINGQLDITGVSESIPTSILNDFDLSFGAGPATGGKDFFTGQMDKIKIYQVTLRPDKILEEYNNNNPYKQYSVSDSLSITDSVATIEGRINSESDPISIIDNVGTQINRFESESDMFSITDNITTIEGRVNTESDPLSITDSITETVTRIDTESDALSITDSITTQIGRFDTESDALSITDSITTIEGRVNTESDPLSITDSVSTIYTYVNSESDALSITDSVRFDILNNESDALSITDSVTTIYTYVNTESDALSITDSVATIEGRLNIESDALSITDSVTTIYARTNSESDPLSITDSVTETVGRIDTESDPLSITDSVTETVGKLDTENDPLSITDNITTTEGRIDTESDPISITDSVTETVGRIDSESDPISITDTVTSLTTRNLPFSEGVDVDDGDGEGTGSPDIGVDRSDSESDPLSLVDSITTITNRFHSTSDQLSLADIINATNSTSIKNISVTESVNATDTGDAGLFVYEPTGKVIWFKVSNPTNATRGGIFESMCDSTEIVTGVNGTGWLKCSTLFAPTNSTRGGVYAATCPGGEWVTGIDDNGDLICADPTP